MHMVFVKTPHFRNDECSGVAICSPMLPLWCTGIAILGNGLIKIYVFVKISTAFRKIV